MNGKATELVAELGASYLAAFSKIEQHTIKNSSAYISNWLTLLKNDRNLLFKAANDGWKACEYVLWDEKEI